VSTDTNPEEAAMPLVRLYGNDGRGEDDALPNGDEMREIRVIIAQELSRTPHRQEINPPDPINPDTGIEMFVFRADREEDGGDCHMNADLLIEIETGDSDLNRNLRTRGNNIRDRVTALINSAGAENMVFVYLKIVGAVWCE
jgi:hypothetical protein